MFNELYEAWLRESETSKLQKLKPDFYRHLGEYFRGLRREVEEADEKSLKGRLKLRELEKAEALAYDLLKLRLKKIFSLFQEVEKPPEALNLAEEEVAVYSKVKEAFQAAEALKEAAISGVEKKPEEKLVLVRFLKEAPALVDSNLKTYGPFKAEDVAYLPQELAEGLIRHNIAKKVKTP
jgi:DNA replication factor GINS